MLGLRATFQSARRRFAVQDGFTLLEILVAATVLAIGTLGAVAVFSTSQKLSLVSERQTTMTQIAQREIERIQGLRFHQIGLTSAPSSSTDSANPDYYVVAGSPPSLKWNRSSSLTESLDVDATNGTVSHVQNWSETTQGGTFSGQIYDYVTWTNDSQCAPGCPANQNYKRIVVAVTMANGLHPNPVYVTSVLADPQAAPSGGVVNGSSGNPLVDPTTTCANGAGQAVPCLKDLGGGSPVTYFLHDWPSNGGTPQPPSGDHPVHSTVGLVTGGLCTTSQTLAVIAANTTGCPQPDLMDNNPPGSPSQPGGSTCGISTLYDYANDLGSNICGREIVPTCQGSSCPVGSQPGTGCSGSTCGGTDSSSDCSDGSWASTLQNPASEFWVSSPLGTGTNFTGDGGISFFTQTVNSTASGLVSFCVEIYDVPPSGSASTLTDILAWPPVAVGGGAYVADNNGSGNNWPSAAGQLSFVFQYSQHSVTIAAGHRVGVRVWFKENLNTAIQMMYDNPNYPAQLQLNTQ
jgi:prepilin-type N-terminal cleavage/methylation domain-containing protein